MVPAPLDLALEGPDCQLRNSTTAQLDYRKDRQEMPTYEYACKSCGERLEVVQSFTDDALTECPSCQGELRKVFGSIGISFKGSGFYKTDSRAASSASSKPEKTEKSDKSEKSEKSDSSKPSESTSKSDTSSKADSTSKGEPAKKSEPKAPAATSS